MPSKKLSVLFMVLFFCGNAHSYYELTDELTVALSLKVVPNTRSDKVLTSEQITQMLDLSNGYFAQCGIRTVSDEPAYLEEKLNIEYLNATGIEGVFSFSNENLQFQADKIGVVFTPGPLYLIKENQISFNKGFASNIGTFQAYTVKSPHVYIFSGEDSPLEDSSATLTHELGHLFGLEHVSEPENIMSTRSTKHFFSKEQCQTMRSTLLSLHKKSLR